MQNKKIKIVHMLWSLQTGGIEVMLIDILNKMNGRLKAKLVIINNFVDIRLLNKISDKTDLILLNRTPGSRNLLKILELNYILLRTRPDIVICHKPNIIRLLLSGKYKKVFHCHEILNKSATKEIDNIRKYDCVISVSKAVSDSIKKYCGIEPTLIYNGLQIAKFKTKANANFKKFRIVHVGRLDHKIKGQDILIKAISKIVNNNYDNNIHVEIIGHGTSKEYLNNMISDLNLSPHCSLLGERDRDWLYRNLHSYNLLIQPSRDEGCGNTILEGMAAGLPVLVSEIPAQMEIIQNGRLGSHFKVDDPNDLAKKIMHVYKNYQKNSILGQVKLAQEHVGENFKIEATINNFISEYKRILLV